MNNFFGRYYYKIRIIFTFCVITIALVIVMTWIGYLFAKDLYLKQAKEKLNSVSGLMALQINKTYLDLFEIGPATISTQNYFSNLFAAYTGIEPSSDVFVFNKHLNIVIGSGNKNVEGSEEANLKINENEIFSLGISNSSTSLPFKGDDGNWYLWGFYRLNQDYWLCIKESAANLEKVDELFLNFIFIGSAGIVITFLLSLFAAKSISKPLENLAGFSAEIGKGKFDSAKPAGLKGEFESLAAAMDKMKTDLGENQKEKEKMLAQIAHEIRNPLGGIELLAGLTKEDLINNSLDTNYIEKILGEVNGLKKLITSFLEYGKPAPPDKEMCDVEKIIEEVADTFKTQLLSRKINVEKKIQKQFVYFDPGHLKQIFINIFMNSIEALDEGGKIAVESFFIKSGWQLIVSDNGRGIPEENLSAVFDPFFTTKKNGTGLGLSVCKKLCMENNALINAERGKENGIKFIISGIDENEI